MKKRILSLAVCLLLALSLLPAAALADTVFAVNVEVPVPLAGQSPSEVKPATGSDVTRIYAYDWRFEGEKLSNYFDTFEKGKTYTLVAVITSTGTFNENTRVYVNGSPVDYEKLDDHDVRISADFTVTEELLNDLTVTLPQLLPGTKISKVAEQGIVEGTEGAVIQAIFWYLNGEEQSVQNRLKADTTYEAGVRLYAREGYRFAVPLRVTCNGQSFSDITGDGETAYFKIQYATGAIGQTAGAVNVEVTEPKTGEKPSNYAPISGGGGFGVINFSDTVPWDYYRSGVEWYDLTAQAAQSYEEPFREGHAYRVSIHYILYDGFEWPDPSVHRINGKAPTGIGQEGDKLTLSCDFPPIDSTLTLKHVDAVRLETEAPAIGAKPLKAWQENGGEKYNNYNVTQWNAKLNRNGTRWFELDGEGNRVKELGEDDAFLPNKQYELEVEVYCHNGYCFTDEAASSATINGQKVNAVRTEDLTEMTLTMTFPALTSSAKLLETVEIGVTAPVAGEHPVYAFTTGSPLLTPYPMSQEMEEFGLENSVLWTDENGKLPTDGTFIAGGDYVVTLYVQVDPDYIVPGDAKVTVNGAEPGEWGFNQDQHALFLMAGMKAKSAEDAEIAAVELTAAAPKAGEQASLAASVPDGAKYTVQSVSIFCDDDNVQLKNGDVYGKKTYILNVTLAPAEGYHFAGESLLQGTLNGEAAQVRPLEDGSALMTKYFPLGDPNPFGDVAESDYFYDAVLWAYYAEPQVTNGISATEFGPMSTVTRGQAVTFLWRAMGCPEPQTEANPFEDVKESAYYYKPVLWAVEKGVTNGTDATHFTPAQTCSTAHILTFLYRTLGIGSNGWYEVAEAWARGAGLLEGLDVTVAPGVDCPRCDVVLFLYRQLS